MSILSDTAWLTGSSVRLSKRIGSKLRDATRLNWRDAKCSYIHGTRADSPKVSEDDYKAWCKRNNVTALPAK